MKNFITFFLISSFLFSGCAPDVIMKHTPRAGEKIRVAVLPLKDAMDAPGSGELAMEALTTHLLKVDAYEIIERGALEQIAKEQKLGATGAIDAETAAQIGKLVGADALIIGAVTEYQPRNFMIFPPAKATVTCRMVRTDTATVEWTATYTLGWHPVKWMASFFWPLGVFFVVTSPSAENRLNKAVGKISKQVAKKSREH